MRIIYRILLGMLIFNLLYLSFAAYFPTGDIDAFETSDSSTVDKYKNINDDILITMLFAGATTFGVALLGLLALNWITRGGISLSIGSVIAITTIATIISTIWSGFSSIFRPILVMGDTNGSNMAGSFYTIFVIVLGVLIALTLAEMFGGQSGVDN